MPAYRRVSRADLDILEKDLLGLASAEPEDISALAAFRKLLPTIELALQADADPMKIYARLKARGIVIRHEDFAAHVDPIMVRLGLIAPTKKRRRRSVSTAPTPPRSTTKKKIARVTTGRRLTARAKRLPQRAALRPTRTCRGIVDRYPGGVRFRTAREIADQRPAAPPQKPRIPAERPAYGDRPPRPATTTHRRLAATAASGVSREGSQAADPPADGRL